jgi:uncharacterized repeat protein (TIGR01451 family)
MTYRGNLACRIALALLAAAVLAFPRTGWAGASVTTADVGITKTLTSPDPAHPGDVITFSITISNAGPNVATNVVWSDVLPPNTTLDEFDPPAGSSCSSPPAGGTGTISCTIASLAVNGSAGPFFIELVPSPDAGTISNTASVTSSSFDPNPDNDASTAVGHVALNQVPAASGWALGALALAMALGGILFLRR